MPKSNFKQQLYGFPYEFTGYLTGCLKKNPMFMRVLTGLRVFTPKWGGTPMSSLHPRSQPRPSAPNLAYPRLTGTEAAPLRTPTLS